MAKSVNLVATREVDIADLVDYVAQQVAVDHPVDRAFENCGDDITPIAAVGALKAAQISEQPGTFCAVGSNSLFVVHEGNHLIAGDALLLSRPVAPAIRRF